MRQSSLSRFFMTSAAALLAAGCLSSASAQTPQVRKFPTTQLNIGIHLIKAEVAQTEAEREQGLMFREKMGDNEGMLFLFGQPAGVCMWMKNTLIPLSVAFMDEKGFIINIEEMKEQTLDSHCAKRAAVYALEMNKGWFKQKNIKPGSKVEGLP
ncbi:signal peptide protein [Herbaspirillum rubrisubalbicans]|uniref:Signal peptide protein n=2 Tax=Herbaspirillum rubrisubalbicans TaxID=80842 RepID=A0ABX9BX70_9BURK|nr:MULTISPECIES: DUF192 domain-containing protein [Herbaspirillum]MCP1576745.1 uncharacterized membrane protein (UPF0127 family) [Herbaspirillum rubrisubalbicans]NQE49124.1 signal peptide protein [Herbaspirillum rubrisubalbicans]QJP99977.1 hypothetical protein C798_06965 [Herbaspirillum rubrisubalbicans Os34]RAM62344.1 signal peptide protein [Herbaspirillum rubrisubalbicans]RAN49631.1 signal peptide protein [Herbaspirillum rubrisubalbicans]